MPRKCVRGGIIGLVVLSVLCPAGLAAESSLSAEIERLVKSAGSMKIGIRVEALSPNPAVIFDYNSGQSFKPASNQKILTTAAAMSLLSEDFTYRTVLGLQGPDLIIVGAGDPSCGDPKIAEADKESITAMFHEWADRLKAAGISSISGDLVFDDTIFDQEYIHTSWQKQFDLLDWYCAPVGGLNFNDNCVDLVIKPGAGMGLPAEVTLIPGTSWIKLQNTTKTAKKGEPVVRRLGAGPITVSVSGAVSKANSERDPLSIAIPDPGMFFASACRTALAAQGITIEGDTKRGRVRDRDGHLPPSLKVVATHERKLSDILWRVDKSSINMFAEAIIKTVGAYSGREDAPGQGSFESGRAVIGRFLQGLGVSEDSYVIDDGSGLSHDNRVTPLMIATLLKHMDRHPRRKEWWANLAVPGEKVGTLRKRMPELAGQVFAKTGHINGVSALSGYVVGANKQVYVFSVLCNDTNRAKVPPNNFQDDICRKLASWGAPASRTTKGG